MTLLGVLKNHKNRKSFVSSCLQRVKAGYFIYFCLIPDRYTCYQYFGGDI